MTAAPIGSGRYFARNISSMAKKQAKAPERIEVPIEWRADMPAIFANQLLIQIDEHECHLSFFEIQPPIVLGAAEERKEALANLKSVQARCVARIVVSKGRLQGFADVIQGASDKMKDASLNGQT